MKNRSEFIFSLEEIREGELRLDSELDVSMISVEDDVSLEFIDINLHGKIRRIKNSEYIFEAKLGGFCNLNCSFCLEPFQISLQESFRVIFLPPLQNKQMKEDDFELVSRDLEVSDITSEGIDLFPSIRDHLLLSIPVQPRCSESCKNITQPSSCAVNNEDSGKFDNRWSVLKDFRLKR